MEKSTIEESKHKLNVEAKLLERVRRVFNSMEDQEHYGFTERAIDYLKLSVS